MRKYWFYQSLKWTLGIMMTDIGSRYFSWENYIFTKTNRSNSAFSSCLNIGIKLSQWWIRITLKTETLRWTNIISHPQRGGQRMLKTKQRRLEIELWTRSSFSCFIRPRGLSDEGWYKWYIHLVSAWSSVKDKLVFILVHDEVIIKLPQKRCGESSSESFISSSKQNNLVSDFIDCESRNVSVFILSLNTQRGGVCYLFIILSFQSWFTHKK